MRRRPVSGLLYLLTGALLLGCAAAPVRAGGLTLRERLGYARWLAAWRATPDSLPAHPLFPLGISAEDCAATLEVPRRRVADQALRQLEDTLSRAWDTAPYRRYGPALKTARDYRTLGLYTEALAWYDAALAGAPRDRRPDLEAEILAVTVAAGDSLQFLHRLLGLLGHADLTGHDAALVIAYRHLLATGDRNNLKLLQDKVARRRERMGTTVLLWHTVSLVTTGRDADALSTLAQVVRRPVPQRLDPRLLGWTVRALPDLLVVAGETGEARRLYAALARENVRRAPAAWARYQLAWAALDDGDYAAAGRLVAELADAPARRWRPRAEQLGRWADRLAAVAEEGRRYGTDRIHRR